MPSGLPCIGRRTPDEKLSCRRPDGLSRWQVVHTAEAVEPSWHSRQVAILGSCIRVPSVTAFTSRWRVVHSPLRSTWTLWLNLRFGVGNSNGGGARRTLGSKPGWQYSQVAGG